MKRQHKFSHATRLAEVFFPQLTFSFGLVHRRFGFSISSVESGVPSLRLPSHQLVVSCCAWQAKLLSRFISSICITSSTIRSYHFQTTQRE